MLKYNTISVKGKSMKRRRFPTLLSFASGLAAGSALLLTASLAHAADLSEVYQQALRNDPQLREAEATRLAALESKPQALSALLPQISAGGSYSKDQTNGSQVVFDGRAFTTRSSESDLTTKGWALTLRQSLFKWDNWAALKQADAQVAQAEADYHTAQQQLVLRTAQAYFNVLAARDTLTAGQSALEAITRQLEQAEKRFEVGLIAVTDVQEAKAAHDQANATVIAGKRALATRLEELRELTGEPVSELKAPGDDMPLTAPSPADEEQWVRQAFDQNLALTSARLSADVAREGISVAKGGHGPTIDLVARKSGSNTNGDTATATTLGTLSNPIDTNSDADSISVQFSIPLYSGGATQSRVRQAVYRHRASRERLERVARETERDARDAYLGVTSEMARVTALKQAVASSQVALEATEAGYEVGTRTAVDVLEARRRLTDAQTNYARSKYDYLLNVLRLRLAAGSLDEGALTQTNALLTQPAPVSR